MLLAVCVTTSAAVEDEKVPLRRLRQQTVHIPDLFEMSTDTSEKNEWTASSSRNAMNSHRRQQLSEMDVFARLLQSDSSLSLSMPAPVPANVPAPVPAVPTPMVVPTPGVVPTVPPPAPTILAPTPTAPVPVATSCPVYPVCASLGLTGECCPTTEGIFLDCCSGIVPAPSAPAPVTGPSVPGMVAPATAPSPVAVIAPTPTTKTKQGMSSPTSPGVEAPSGSMSGSMSGGSMNSPTSPGGVESPSGSMSKASSPSSSTGSSMSSSGSMGESKSGSMS